MPGSTQRFLVSFPYILVPLALAATGCSDGPATPAATVADSAGVEIVTSRGAGWSPDEAWRLELDLEVGAVEGPDAFARLADVAPRAAGGLWVTDAQDRRVRGFDDDGREVVAFGRAGDGPGEFRSVGRVTDAAGGGVAIGGRMPPELYRFTAEGDHVETVAVNPDRYREPPAEDRETPMGPTLGQWRFAGDGSAYLQAATMDLVDGDIVRADVLLRLEEEPPGSANALKRWASPVMTGGPGGEIRLLEPEPSWTPGVDGEFWFTSGETYDVQRYDGSGTLVSIMRRRVARAPVTARIRAALLADLEAEADNPAMLAMLAGAVFPDSLPATSALWISEPDGHVWVGVMDPDLPWRAEAPNAWDVFAPDGPFLGRLPIPDGLRPTRITSGYVYGVWLDDLEVNHARRYRIARNE